MLTREQLVELERRLRERWVLSVYVDATVQDPAERGAWRVKLDTSLAAIRLSLRDATHDEREAFAAATARLHESLAAVSGALRSTGWVAFVTDADVPYAEGLPVPMPTLVTWERGMRIAPYLRALREHRPAIVALLDSHHARLYRYQLGRLESVETLHAHAVVGPVYHMGDAPDPGFHGGVRGTTGTDANQRTLREGLRRMLVETAERISTLAGSDAWIVLGGTPQPTQALATLLAEHEDLKPRIALPSLHVWCTEAEIARVAATTAGEMRARRDLAVMAGLVEGTPHERFAAFGQAATRRALRAGAVRELLVSRRFLDEFASAGERLVRAALDEGAEIEEVSGAAADRLDALCGGVAARLRFGLPAMPTAVPNEETAAPNESDGPAMSAAATGAEGSGREG